MLKVKQTNKHGIFFASTKSQLSLWLINTETHIVYSEQLAGQHFDKQNKFPRQKIIPLEHAKYITLNKFAQWLYDCTMKKGILNSLLHVAITNALWQNNQSCQERSLPTHNVPWIMNQAKVALLLLMHFNPDTLGLYTFLIRHGTLIKSSPHYLLILEIISILTMAEFQRGQISSSRRQMKLVDSHDERSICF